MSPLGEEPWTTARCHRPEVAVPYDHRASSSEVAPDGPVPTLETE
jgi:hypothetical protein